MSPSRVNSVVLTLTVVFIVFCLSNHFGVAQPIDLHFAYFTSGPEGGFDSSGSVPAVEIAQEQILRNTTILNGYRLSHTAVLDTMCDRTLSLDGFLTEVPFSDPPVLGLLGCGCSVASEPVAEIIHHWNLPQIAYASAAITLSEPRFRNFFRTYPSDGNFIPAISSVIEFYGWRRVAFITQDENLFLETFDGVQSILRASNINVRNRMVESSLPVRRLSRTNFFFQNEYTRIFFINTYSDVARVIICEAYKQGLTNPLYVWLTYGWYQDRWWTEEINAYPIDCTDDQLSDFVHRTLAIQVVPTPRNASAPTDTGLTPYEFDQLYRERLDTAEAETNNYTFTFVSTLAYDATWALALALDKTAAMVNDTSGEIFNKTGCRDEANQFVPLENFTYDNALMGCVVRYQLQNTNFRGVSGVVQFDAAGTRIQRQIRVLQYRVPDNAAGVDEVEQVGFAYTDGNMLSYFENESSDTVFPGGIPHDGIPIQRISTVHISLIVIYDILAGVGIAFTTACLVFNFVFRKRKVIKLTSPRLNYFILAGTYITYTTVIIRLIPSTSTQAVSYRCSIDSFLVTIGYCLAYGTVLAKMGRVYQIFHKASHKKNKLLQDWHLMLIVMAITVVGLLFAILEWAIPQLRLQPALISNQEGQTGMTEFGVVIEYSVWYCYAGNNTPANVFLFVKLAYFGLLLIVGIILAIQTRKVSVKVLNDSKYIAALTYITSISLILSALFNYTLRGYIHINEVIYSGGILVTSTSFLCLIFIPKMVSLYRDPLGENVFQTSKRSQPSMAEVENSITLARALDKDAEKIAQLEAKIRELEKSIEHSAGGDHNGEAFVNSTKKNSTRKSSSVSGSIRFKE